MLKHKMTDSRTSALFKRAEQLKRWEESDTNQQSPTPKPASKIQFSLEVVFLAACSSGDKDEVKRLLDIGADINTGNVDGLTALHQACIDDNLDMVEFLVTHGADVNCGDNEGWTPLHATASCGFLSIARYLIENGADLAAVNYDGDLPVDITENEDMEEYLRQVIDEKGIDCDRARSAEVDNLMSDAKYWAENGYPDVRDPKTGGTPLHVSAAKGYSKVIKTLLEECKAEPDCVDYQGWTPLHAAALWGQKDAVAVLLKYGADPTLKNYSGQTCIDLADPNMALWLNEATRRFKTNKRKRSPPRHDVKRVDLQPEPQPDKIVNGNKLEKSPLPPPVTTDNGTSLRRTHSFETDNTFYQRYRDVTARIKATSCPTIPPLPQSAHGVVEQRKTNQEATSNNNNNVMETVNANEDVQARINPSERRDRLANTWNAPAKTTNNSSLTNTTTQTTVRRSFVPPVRDEESETQRKAHAKRVRETRRSTQGVTLDELKSAEQLVKKRAGNGTAESSANNSNKVEDGPISVNTVNSTFELEDAGQSLPKASTSADATVTLPLRRPPSGSSVTTALLPSKEDNRTADDGKDRDSSSENKSPSGVSATTPASTQAALNVIQRRRRPKRRSTGVGHVDMDEIANERGKGGDGDGEDALQSGSERTDDGDEPRDYKALYEASESEVRRLRAMLATSEQQLRDARATITTLSQVNQNSSLSEIEKREKRAMERKLSEMEEELKNYQALQVENARLKDENGALIRVISKLSK